MRNRRRLLAILPLVALAIAGCGGGDDDATDAAPAAAPEAAAALSKEELLAQGDAVCAEVNAAVGTVASTGTGSEAQATQVADLYGGMVERLKGLGAPSDDSAGYEEFIGAAEQLAQAESDVALAAERGEGEALATAESEASAALDSFQGAAAAFGFEQCGEAPSAPSPAGSGAEEEGSEAPAEAVEPEEEAAPEAEEEAAAAPETGGAGAGGEEGSGGGAAAGGGTEGSGGGTSGGIGPG